MDGGAWKAAVRGVAEGWIPLSDFTFTFHFHTLEKEMATHSSVLAWRIPGTGEPSGLPSMGSHRVGHDWSDLAAAATERERHQDSFGPRAEVAHPCSRAKGGESPLLESQGLGVCMLQQTLMSHWRYFRGGSKYWAGQKVHSGFSNGLFFAKAVYPLIVTRSY